MHPTIIVLYSGDTPLVFTFCATDKERNLLSIEIKLYNDWIKQLFDGRCPESSYTNPEDADQYYLARRMIRRNNTYDGEFERPGNRGFFEKETYYFALYFGDESECIELVGDIAKMGTIHESSSMKNYELDSLKSLSNIIVNTLGEEFGLGYRLFPVTKRIIDRN